MVISSTLSHIFAIVAQIIDINPHICKFGTASDPLQVDDGDLWGASAGAQLDLFIAFVPMKLNLSIRVVTQRSAAASWLLSASALATLAPAAQRYFAPPAIPPMAAISVVKMPFTSLSSTALKASWSSVSFSFLASFS